ncbi:MAG: OpgC domain-containing protein [Nocardioidaceae bacterium]
MSVPGPGAPSRPGRDLRIDFFRGLALLTIFVDHVRGDPWGRWTLREYGLVTALDVFILLAGVSGYLAYGTRLGSGWRDGRDGLRRLFRRVATVYGAHLGLVLSLVLLAGVVGVLWPSYPVLPYLQVSRLVHDPWPTVLQVVTMSYQPRFCGILPVYVLLLPTLPLVVWGMRVSRLLPLGVGLVAFGVAVFTDLGFPFGGGDEWRIDPLKWFVVYAAGIVLGSLAGRPPWHAPRWVTWLAVGWLAVTLLDDAPWQALPGLAGVTAPTVALGVDLHAQPWAEVLRLVSLAAAGWLVLRVVPARAAWLRAPSAVAVNRVGAASLPMFWIGAVLSAAATIVAVRLGESWAAYTAVTALGVVALLGAARLRATRFPRRTSSAPAVTTQPT